MRKTSSSSWGAEFPSPLLFNTWNAKPWGIWSLVEEVKRFWIVTVKRWCGWNNVNLAKYLSFAFASLKKNLSLCFIDYNNEDEFGRKLRFLLQQLPPVNYSLLKFLCRFLANVASHHEEIWSANSLAAVFGPDVFQ